ncbi:MAG: ETC complex I subunit [Rhodospirillales bacterium]|nr:ETC complex I subunit [Rhodospirillales bacterium]
MNVIIYKPAKNAMQSGRAKTKSWQIRPESGGPRRPEPIMGWTSTEDTLNTVKLAFDTKDEAIAYAKKKGWSYTVGIEHARKVRPRNYGDKFRYIPIEE